ncbi:MAG: hypothetical protein ACJAU6_003486 [Alphaproteobacteria bacterium]
MTVWRLVISPTSTMVARLFSEISNAPEFGDFVVACRKKYRMSAYFTPALRLFYFRNILKY